MSKLVIGLAAFVLLAAGGALAGGALTGSSRDETVTTATTDAAHPIPTGTTKRTETGEDVRGPCDEAEHVNDPLCAGGAVVRLDDGDDRARADGDDRAEDRADDEDDDDRSGPNRGHGGGDDRSGPNRGSGHD